MSPPTCYFSYIFATETWPAPPFTIMPADRVSGLPEKSRKHHPYDQVLRPCTRSAVSENDNGAGDDDVGKVDVIGKLVRSGCSCVHSTPSLILHLATAAR